MVWFTADTHFFHDNIRGFCKRPWIDVQTMNDALADNWNSVVGPSDEIYVIGDFIWPKGVAAQDVGRLLRKLHGAIHLIPGDHDMTEILNHIMPGKVRLHQQIHSVHINEKERIVLCHWPMRNWPTSHYNSIHLFGHVHNNCKPDVLYTYGRSFNVGIDVWDFKPVSLTQVMDNVKTLGDNPNYIKRLER